MKNWFHVNCMFDTFLRARANTKKIDDVEVDIEDWDTAKDEDKEAVLTGLKAWLAHCKAKGISNPAGNKTTTPSKVTPKKHVTDKPLSTPSVSDEPENSQQKISIDPNDEKYMNKDNSFREFRRLCANIGDHSSYLSKTEEVHKFLTKGTGGDKFRGDLELWVRLLLPGVIKRVYNLQSKQLVKVFSQVLYLLCTSSVFYFITINDTKIYVV